MSKRKGSSTNRQSKRHKSNSYDDGKTDLQREMELYQQQQEQEAQEEIYRAQQALQRQQQQSNNTNQMSYNNTSNIQDGTPISDDDMDDIDNNNQYGNNIVEDSESDYVEEDAPVSRQEPMDYSPNKQLNKNQKPVPDPITLSDLRAVQMKRSQIEKICTEPFFADFIGRSQIPIPNDPEYARELPGLFCRIYIGDRQTSTGGNEPIYRICEMINVEDWKRSYVLSDKKTITNVGLLIAHGRNERVFKIIQTSNSPFSEKEFQQWKQTLRDDGLPLPTKDELSEAYLNAIKRHKNFKYDAISIAKMREKKNKNFNAKLLANPHKEKLRISTIIGGLNEDDRERLRYEKYLADINKEIERRNSMQSQSIKVSIASINEKNKIKNKKLMVKAREKERKLRSQMKIKGRKQMKDPFTRAITAPTIESFNDILDENDVNKNKENNVNKKENVKTDVKEDVSEMNDYTISILKDKKRIIKKYNYKPIVSGNEKDGLSLIKSDELWSSVVHGIAKEFVEKCQGIEINDSVGENMRQPQFGRNTNPSKYGNKFTKRPRDLQIISIDEYLRNKYKYSTM